MGGKWVEICIVGMLSLPGHRGNFATNGSLASRMRHLMKILALVLSPWWQGVCDICTPCPCDPGRVVVVVLQAHRTQSSILSSANNCDLCCYIYPELVSHMLPHLDQLHHTRAERPLKTGDLRQQLRASWFHLPYGSSSRPSCPLGTRSVCNDT